MANKKINYVRATDPYKIYTPDLMPYKLQIAKDVARLLVPEIIKALATSAASGVRSPEFAKERNNGK